MAIENKAYSTNNNASSAVVNGDTAVRKTRVIAFTSGKGGVGKTSLSVNMAVALARSGSKVCLFDADMGLANVNIMLGITPAYTLEHLFTHEKSIQDIVLTGPAGLDIVPGASGFSKCVELDEGQQQKLVAALEYLEPQYDYLIIDTSAGISSTVLHFVAAAQMAAVVITPEPTSLTDAFSLLKVLRRRGYKRTPQVVVNMAQSASKADKIYRRFDAAVKKYIGMNTEYLGSVWMDESIRASVTLQRPVSLLPESDPSCKSFYRLADSLDSAYRRGSVPDLSFTTYWKKVVERSIRRRAEKHDEQVAKSDSNIALKSQSTNDTYTAATRSAGAPVAGTPVAGALTADTAQSPAEGLADANVHPLHESSEDQWIDLRIRLNQFLQNDDTTPEQVTTLLSSCIFTYGEQLGGAASDLLHGLLQVIDPSALSDEHRDLIVQDLERLKLVPKSAINSMKGVANNAEGSEQVAGESEQVNEATVETVTVPQKHQYDEKGFGCQDRLVEKIKASSGTVSLDSLLESIKYASLVDS